MKFVLFYHSPATGWSLAQQQAEYGEQTLHDFRAAYPQLENCLRFYELEKLHLDIALLLLLHTCLLAEVFYEYRFFCCQSGVVPE